MSLTIIPPPNFMHAGHLSPRFDTSDPRKTSFDAAQVDIDLRECEFVRPAAALWCIVYLALASKRGASCRLLVPNNTGVCIYLKSLGVFNTLKDCGVKVDDRGIGAHDLQKTILPVTRFQTTAGATDVTKHGVFQIAVRRRWSSQSDIRRHRAIQRTRHECRSAQ